MALNNSPTQLGVFVPGFVENCKSPNPSARTFILAVRFELKSLVRLPGFLPLEALSVNNLCDF